MDRKQTWSVTFCVSHQLSDIKLILYDSYNQSWKTGNNYIKLSCVNIVVLPVPQNSQENNI